MSREEKENLLDAIFDLCALLECPYVAKEYIFSCLDMHFPGEFDLGEHRIVPRTPVRVPHESRLMGH